MFLPLRLKLTLYTLFFIIVSTSLVLIVVNDYLLVTTHITINYYSTELVLLIIGIILVTLFISMYFLNKLINTPLNNILQQIDTLMQGNYDESLQIKQNDEFGMLAERFNEMVKQIYTRERRLDAMLNQDILTKIPNRVMFNQRLEDALSRAKRLNTNIAVYFIDLDEFKVVNDTLGHDLGDKLLVQVANNLIQVMRKNDLLARIGGDEFNVLVEDLESIVVAEKIAQKITEQLSIPINLGEIEVKITGSVGVAIYPIDAKNSRTLLKNADLAMYDAKNDGKNRYKFFSEELSVTLKNRSTILSELKLALNRDEFELYYQPKFNLQTGVIDGAEALIRWKCKKLGFISPDGFIALAEESGEIVKIGRWIVDQACKDFKMFQENNLDIKQISINISNVQFDKDNIVQVISSALQKYQLDAKHIEVEITESYVHKNSKDALSVLNKLRELGIDLAMDDFGTGYSSMSYLKRLPLTRLKIDKSFIDNIPFSSDDVEITKIIIALAKVMKLKITAEGIEAPEQMEFLQQLDCDEGQGYICSKPLMADQFINLLKSKPNCTNPQIV
jgi:diguanylate cyclase (GGDEF)-like protein